MRPTTEYAGHVPADRELKRMKKTRYEMNEKQMSQLGLVDCVDVAVRCSLAVGCCGHVF
jgi:hypothetical protein